MGTEPENQDQEQDAAKQQQIKDNEELARSIPTVTPDTDNLEPEPEKNADQ